MSEPFKLIDGTIITTLDQLQTCLETMNEVVFRKHWSAQRNEFAVWVKREFKDYKIAGRIEKFSEPKPMAIELKRALIEKKESESNVSSKPKLLTLADQIKIEFMDIKKQVAEKRRLGLYTKLAEIRLYSIPPRIKYLEVDQNAVEANKIREVFKEVIEELKVEYP